MFVVLLALGAAPAGAHWSTPVSVPVTTYGMNAVAVDARGDAAVAWASSGSPARSPTYKTSVRVSVRAWNGRVRTHRVWSSTDANLVGISVAIDRRGETTVAWITKRRHDRLSPTGTVRAAYGTLAGHWTEARVVGQGRGEPRLAVAADREVLLVWIGGRITTAWRSPGHPFGTPRTLVSPHVQPGLPRSGPLGAIPSFDARGRAYLAGECEAVVHSTAPHSHRFGHKAALDLGAKLGVSFSVTPAGDGLASWVNGRCTTDESAGDTPGPVFASVMRAGRFGPPLPLTAATTQFTGSNALATSGGGGTVTWSTFDPAKGTFGATIGSGGSVGPAYPITDPLTALVADGGGDQVLTGTSAVPGHGGSGTPPPGGQLVQGGVAIRAAGGGADQPAPHGNGRLAVATPVGRAAALVWSTSPTGVGGRLAVSVWRP
jgi:hypothetical protein